MKPSIRRVYRTVGSRVMVVAYSTCVQCGLEFEVTSRGGGRLRCPPCRAEHDRLYQAAYHYRPQSEAPPASRPEPEPTKMPVISGEHPPYAIMGPAPCQGCGTFVWWARARTRLDGEVVPGLLTWREQGGAVHAVRCPAGRAVA